MLKWESLQSPVTYLSTDINSLINNNGFVGAAINNDDSAALWPFCSIEVALATQGTNRSNYGIAIYAIPSIDGGTTYPYGAATLLPAPELLVATLTFPQGELTARTTTVHGIQIPGAKFKFVFWNNTGQTLASSGNTMKYAFHSVKDSS